jgi:hypothetical protein
MGCRMRFGRNNEPCASEVLLFHGADHLVALANEAHKYSREFADTE